MVRTPGWDKNGLKKGTWTREEDRKLIAYINSYGCWNWRQLPKYAGLSRCGKSCRLRWMNHLRPDIKRGNYTKEEEEAIMRLHEALGNRWSAIAAHLPGRTDNEVKNHWHSYLKKRVKHNSISREQNPMFYELAQNVNSEDRKTPIDDSPLNSSIHQVVESSPPLSPQQSTSSEQSSSATETEVANCTVFYAEDDVFATDIFAVPTENFWTTPFLTDDFITENDVATSLLIPEFLSPPSPFTGEEFLCLYDDKDINGA